MFKVDRKSAASSPFPGAGTYNVTVAAVTYEISPKGDPRARLIFRDSEGHVVSDLFWAAENVEFKLQKLIASCPEFSDPDGTEYNLRNKEVFDALMIRFKGLRTCVVLAERQSKDDPNKKYLEVLRYQTPTGASEEVLF